MSIKEKLVLLSPYIIQNTAITAYNTYQYKIRHGGKYKHFREYYSKVNNFSQDKLEAEVVKKKRAFFDFVRNNSHWYNLLLLSLVRYIQPLASIAHKD